MLCLHERISVVKCYQKNLSEVFVLTEIPRNLIYSNVSEVSIVLAVLNRIFKIKNIVTSTENPG